VFCLLLAACGRIDFDPIGGSGAPLCSPAPMFPPVSGGGFDLVRAWGGAPDALVPPSTDAVELAWESRGAVTYRVVRTQCAADPDPSSTAPCTSDTVGSCRACETTTTQCLDAAASPAPSQLHYQVVVLDNVGQPTAMLDDPDYRVDVAVPPPNMVLVHRASVNREMCDLLGSPTDPAEHHRCAYSGPGGVPLRAHPDSPDLMLPDGFYDFGYDLFVDRWESGCPWTHQADGGMCGTGSSPGDCTSNDPSAPLGAGVTGNVFWGSYHGRCFVMTSSGWQESWIAAPADAAAAAATYTNAPGPGHDRPPLTNMTVQAAVAICNASTVPVYGAKRPWRQRELVASGAFARLPNDPDFVDATAITEIEAGLNHPATHACNVQTHNGVTPMGFRSGDELARDVAISTDPAEQADMFVLGSVGTSRCVSRYGVQDLIGNEVEILTDQFAACGSGVPCVGKASSFDAGNTDLAGLALDGVTGAGPTITVQPLESFPKVLLALAMPLAATAPFGQAPDPTQLRGDTFLLISTGSVFERIGIAGGWDTSGSAAGRFQSDFGGNVAGGNNDVTWGMRCVVAAVPR
jgi:hypothetical protein